MDFDQIVAKYPGERYQAHLGLLLVIRVKPKDIRVNKILNFQRHFK